MCGAGIATLLSASRRHPLVPPKQLHLISRNTSRQNFPDANLRQDFALMLRYSHP